MKKIMYRLLDALLRPLGYGIWNREFIKRRINRATLHGTLMHMRNNGLRPATVFDVGVADGTPALQSVFYDVPQILLEPLSEYAEILKALEESHLNITVIPAAAGAEPGSRLLGVPGELDSSSFYASDMGNNAREVTVVTLDELQTRHNLAAPYLIKADVEGAELDVIAGAENILENTVCVILETTLMAFRDNTPLTGDVIAYMSARGFALHDIVGLVYRPLDDALARVDLVFVPEDSSLRQDTRFATREHHRKRAEKFNF
jgi:FkbM family methyltransferase